jgi:pimeloyl-ACP methyl ester carboxylesterase
MRSSKSKLHREVTSAATNTHVLYLGRDLAALRYFSYEPSRDNTIVLTFDYLRGAPRIEPRPHLRRALRKLGYHQVHVFCSWDHWFQTRELDAFADVIARTFAGMRVVAMGGSMGGFGALRFAARCEVDRVAIISPQCFIDGQRDARYEKEWKVLEPEGCPRSVCETIALFDPANAIDKLHIMELRRVQPHVIAVPMHFYGHWIDDAMDQKSDLTDLVESLLRVEFAAKDVRALARRNRLESKHYSENVAQFRRKRAA